MENGDGQRFFFLLLAILLALYGLQIFWNLWFCDTHLRDSMDLLPCKSLSTLAAKERELLICCHPNLCDCKQITLAEADAK